MGIGKFLGFAGQSGDGSGGPEGGFKGGTEPAESSGFTGAGSGGTEGVVHPDDVELHVVDGRLIACRPGEAPPLSARQHAKAFLEWLRGHDKVPGNEVPVGTMEHVLYRRFAREAGLPARSWRAVSDILATLPGVKKYQADWRDAEGGQTPMVFKISRRRRAKVVQLDAARRAG